MTSLQSVPGSEKRETRASVSAWSFRPAQAGDAEACAPLVYASGPGEFAYFLGVSAAQCIAFIASGFASDYGRFSWRRHRVAVTRDGTVVGVMALHDGRSILLDDPHVAWSLLRHFGPMRTPGILGRGLVLETELPAPKRNQCLIAHCAIDERLRGTGVFTALFEDARSAGLFDIGAGRALLIDVRLGNPRARALYERLGFSVLPRRREPSGKLPAELVSARLAYAD